MHIRLKALPLIHVLLNRI